MSNLNDAKSIVDALEKEFEQTKNEIPNAETNQYSAEDTEGDDNPTNEDTNDNVSNSSGVSDISNNDPAPTITKTKKSLSRLVKPKHAVNVVDFIIPAVIVFVTDRIGYTIVKRDLQLDKDEKELLQPFIEDFLENVTIDLSNPYINLAAGITIVYGMKILDSKPRRKDEITPTEELSPAAQFEEEYNILIEDILKTEKAKGRKSAMKYLADNNPEKIKSLMEKYSYTDDKYLRYSTEYLKELNQNRYKNFTL